MFKEKFIFKFILFLFMPHITQRKLFKIGHSEAITIPKFFLDQLRKDGKLKNDILELTVNEYDIIIEPKET